MTKIVEMGQPRRDALARARALASEGPHDRLSLTQIGVAIRREFPALGRAEWRDIVRQIEDTSGEPGTP